jgi:hypothetical protein
LWPSNNANKLDKMFDIFIEKTPAIKILLVEQEHATLGAPGSYHGALVMAHESLAFRCRPAVVCGYHGVMEMAQESGMKANEGL